MRVILLFTFSIFSFFLSAQTVFIVEDFQNCGTGIKDSSGKWIVQPLYNQIENLGMGFYRISLGSKQGVVNSNGKTIVPPIYDYIDGNTWGIDSLQNGILFKIENLRKRGNKFLFSYYGVIDAEGKIIVPIKHRWVQLNRDGSVLALTSRKHYAIYLKDGTCFPIKKKLPESPDYLAPNVYRISNYKFGLMHQEYYWIPRRKINYGLISDSLREIIPVKFSFVNYNPSNYKLVYVEKKKKAGFYNLNGKNIWPVVFAWNYGERYSSYNSWDGIYTPNLNEVGYAPVFLKKKAGIIGANGDTLLPFIYDDVRSLHLSRSLRNSDLWSVEKDDLHGVYNPNLKKWIVPMEYSWIDALYHFDVKGDSTGDELLLVAKNGKFGLITTRGNVILPVEYDGYSMAMDDGIIFQKDSTYFSLTFPTYVDDVKLNYLYDDNFRNDNHVVHSAPANGKFEEVKTKSGATLFINPDLISSKEQKGLYHNSKLDVITNPETFDSLLHAAAMVLEPMKQTATIPGVGIVFEFHSTAISINKNEEWEKRFCINPKYPWMVKNVVAVAEDSFYTYYNINYGEGVYRSDGKILLYPDKYDNFVESGYERNGLAYFNVTTRRHRREGRKDKEGVMDGNGKFVVDTIWANVDKFDGQYALVKKNNRGIFYDKYYYRWNILDVNTNTVLLSKKQLTSQYTDFGNQAAVLESKNGPKLFDMKNRKMLLTGNVNDIYSLGEDDDYFVVRTCSGKMGIISNSGKWMADTVWNTFLHASEDSIVGIPQSDWKPFCINKDFRSQAEPPFRYYVLSNDTGWIIFDSKKKILTKDNVVIKHLLYKSKNSFRNSTTMGIEKFSTNSPSWFFANDSLNQKKLADWQEKLFFDSLFTAESFVTDTDAFYHVYSCRECLKRNVQHNFDYQWAKNYDHATLNHTVQFSNDSVFSVTRENLSYRYRFDEKPSDLFFTVMLFSDGPHGMLLDSLFVGAWKPFITKTVMNYLDTNLHVTGNCSNPYMLPIAMKNRFCISEKGIILFPPGYKEYNNQLEILMTWEMLKPYLRKDVASKIISN